MNTKLPRVAKSGKSARFRLWVTALFFIALCSSVSTVWAQTGLHYTPAEVAVWRQRANATATSGTTNYRVNGDVQAYSPGDWTRILANANNFKGSSNTDSTKLLGDRWIPWPGTGPYPRNDDSTIHAVKTQGRLLEDAAFVYLVKQDTSYLPRVKSEILKYVRNPLLNFSNRIKWVYLNDDYSGFTISEILMRILMAYDFAKGGFTSAESAEVQTFFLRAGEYYNDNINSYYASRFTDGSHQTLSTNTTYEQGYYANLPQYVMPIYYGGPVADWMAQHYSNRMATEARFLGHTAIFCNNETLKSGAKRWFKEWMRFGVLKSMDIVDMHRSIDNKKGPESGLNYSFGVAGVMIDLADVLARKGDDTLYNFSTVDGYVLNESVNNPKTLYKVITNLQNYLNGTFKRYATRTDTVNLSPQQKDTVLINGVDLYQTIQQEITYDTWFSVANKYYRSATIKSNYLRQAPGTRPYPGPTPKTPRSIGPNYPFGGQAAIYPGCLFMYGQMENTTASPYSKLPVITWSNPTPIVYGTALSSTQLNASASVAGTFVYSPNAGVVLNAGPNQNLVVTFMPTDTFNFKSTSATVLITVNKATPVITWPTPAPIVYGTALSGTQLNATTSVNGSFVYSPSAGVVLSPGVNQALTTTFTPDASAQINFVNSVQNVLITVNPATTPGPAIYSPINGATNVAINVNVQCYTIANASSYTFEVNTSPSFTPATAITKTSSTTWVAYNGLQYSTFYYVRAKSNLSTSWGATSTFTTNPVPSPAIYLPVNGATNVAINVNVQCYTIANASSYTFEVNTSASFTPATAITKTGAATWVAYTGLQYSTLYYVRAKSNLSAAWGTTSTFTTKAVGGARVSAEDLTESTIPRMSVFPNPSTGKVFVHFTTTATEYASVNMYNMWGGLAHPLFAGTVEGGEENRIEMDGRPFATGMYIIRLTTPNKVDFQKIILMK